MVFRLRFYGAPVVTLLLAACTGGTVIPGRQLAAAQNNNVPYAPEALMAPAPTVPTSTPWVDAVAELAPGCKRGVAFDFKSAADVSALAPGVSWFYSWSVSPNKALDANAALTQMRYTPMIWGSRALTDLPIAPLSQSDVLLGFNEPNFFSQANLSPQQAAALWPQVEAAAMTNGMKLVSPALNYCGGGCWTTSPFAWLDAFFAACPACHVDYIAVHWYACTKSALVTFLQQVETRYKKKIWLTEFACGDGKDRSAAAQLAYMKEAVAYLESDPMVVRYAWFTGRWPEVPGASLLAADGQLTDLGRAYVNFPQTCVR